MTLKPVDENCDKTQQRGEINVPEIQKKKKHLEIKYHCERKEQTAARWIKKRKNKRVKQWLNCTITFYILK